MTLAEFPKKCPGCGEYIEEGDVIGVVDGEWVCEACLEEAGDEDEYDR